MHLERHMYIVEQNDQNEISLIDGVLVREGLDVQPDKRSFASFKPFVVSST